MCIHPVMHKLTRSVDFRVKATLEHGEQMFIVGSCKALGLWQHYKAVPLTLLESAIESNIWGLTIEIPAGEVVHYRYFAGQVEDTSDKCKVIIVKKWETQLLPRVAGDLMDCDIFGVQDGETKLNRGWLTHQTDVQLRLHSNAVKLWSEQHQSLTLTVKCSPMSLSNELNKSQEANSQGSLLSNQILVSVLNATESIPKSQGENGVPYVPESYTMFKAQTMDLSSQAYIFEVFCYEVNQNQPDAVCPVLLGTTIVLPSHLQDLAGVISLPLIAPTCTPIGQLTVDFLVTKPMLTNQQADMSVSYQHHWNPNQGTRHMGHRGMGSSFGGERCALVTENTIASFSGAGKHGAAYVELDVMLTKDRIPVIYHDFKVAVETGHKNSEECVKEIAVNEMTLEELRSLKLYHTKALTDGKSESLYLSKDAPVTERIFPTMKEAFEHTNPSVCFNIEVKYSMTMCDGSMEGNFTEFTERNEYLDIIIQDVIQNAGDRKVVFSCFDPDVCTMLRLKQNRYPVNMLSMGATERWPPYKDLRTRNIPIAAHNALAEDFLGVNAHTEDLLKDMALITQIKNMGLVLWTWGPDNNNVEVLCKLQEMGVDGLCYDRVDLLKPQVDLALMEKMSSSPEKVNKE